MLDIDEKASSNEIKKAYYLKIREYPNETHPVEFQELTKAYKVLSNQESRAKYDHESKDDGAYSKLLTNAIESMNKEQYDSALISLEKMLKTYPNDLAVQQNIAICYISLEKFEDAKRVLLQIEVMHPNDEMTLSLLGETFLNLEMYDFARKYYKKLVSLNPGESNYCIFLARAYANLGNFHTAFITLEEKIKQQGKETIYDFPLLQELFFLTMAADKLNYHKRVILRIQELPKTSDEKIILLRMIMNLCESLDNRNNGFKELVYLVKDINGNEFAEVNEWLKEAESYIRSDLIYYGDSQPANQSTNSHSGTSGSNVSADVQYQEERGSILVSVVLGIIASFIFTPIVGIIVGFIWYFKAGSIKTILSCLGCLVVVLLVIGFFLSGL
ncbi:J domain-containing protein [Neobacillus piezotolerans]|uniref:J domain-containing protein n=1 Tax=Neobacillus piezotolerans TaxID=2259171 RepID=UPI0015F13CAC|nr:tetratricopeptide repeat protein [Neobacillus piezotolerans]